MIIPFLPLIETIGTMTDAHLVVGLTFLHGKAISCQNPYVTFKVQTGAAHYQAVSKYESIVSHVYRLWQNIQWLSSAAAAASLPPALKRRGFQKGTIGEGEQHC
jgi:hypothetical protein